MTVTDELLAELEEAAINATQDEWELLPGTNLSGPEVIANGEPIAWVLNSEADAVHIAAANPATITALTAELRRLRAENAELERVVKDVRWRVADTTDQLQAYHFNGDRLYGLDEWSVPIRNLNIAIGMLEKAAQ